MAQAGVEKMKSREWLRLAGMEAVVLVFLGVCGFAVYKIVANVPWDALKSGVLTQIIIAFIVIAAAIAAFAYFGISAWRGSRG